MQTETSRRGFIAAAAVLAPAVAMAGSIAASNPDAAILDAWHTRAAAFDALKHADGEERDRLEAVIDASDTVIHSTAAQTSRGVEIQIWAALHAGEAYLDHDEAAILRMDADYIRQNRRNFDWNVLPLLSAITSLRGMGDKA